MLSIDHSTQALLAKPLATAVTAGLADRYFLGTADMTTNATFAGVVGASVMLADLVGKYGVNKGTEVVKSLETRAIEIGVSVPSAIMLERYVNPRVNRNNTAKKALAVLGSEIIGEWLSTSFLGLNV